jgi:imidazole glycerol phosphate synthase subunit HisF
VGACSSTDATAPPDVGTEGVVGGSTGVDADATSTADGEGIGATCVALGTAEIVAAAVVAAGSELGWDCPELAAVNTAVPVMAIPSPMTGPKR